jgi:toxin ParE1/3/4
MNVSGDHSETRSSRRLEFSKDADLDLRSILRYTNRTWGSEQRDRYADRLIEAMHELLVHPQIGPAQDAIAPGLRSRRVGQHVIYYRVLAESIRIVRILHARMSPEQHLRGRS